MTNSGVGGGGEGGASAPPKVLICRKFGQNLNEIGCKRTVTTAVETDGDNDHCQS